VHAAFKKVAPVKTYSGMLRKFTTRFPAMAVEAKAPTGAVQFAPINMIGFEEDGIALAT
jgi:hypothetical protein